MNARRVPDEFARKPAKQCDDPEQQEIVTTRDDAAARSGVATVRQAMSEYEHGAFSQDDITDIPSKMP
ncbi:hypothetical protein DIE07_12250 [Burkholderia sp. Bp9002]|nr:hypothetical protein DIE07_12250 [Burkholderia sp. Bp9002]